MKIAIDIRTAGGNRAGKGWYTFNLTRSLLKNDHQNQYILYADSGIAGFEEFKNVELKIIEQKGASWHLAVAKDIKSTLPDIFFGPSSYIIPSLLPKNKIKIVFTVHDLVAFLFKGTHQRRAVIIEKLFLKKALKKAAKVLTVSQNTKKDLQEFFKIEDERIAVIPCAAEETYSPTQVPDTFKKETNLPDNFFIAVGTIEPRKNYETLIQAFAMVHEKYPTHHLVIVGEKGWGKTNLEESITSNYLQKYVHILGYLTTKTINKLYNLAEALVFPSYYEGFGMPPLEAMSSGCPVICSNTSSLPEVVGDAAITCDPEVPAEFAEAMEKIIQDKPARADLINKGRIQIQKFSWDKSAKDLLEIFKTL